jgi:hypothetical protein
MRRYFILLIITLMGFSAEASLELHSLRCSSNNLTLDLYFVANQNVPEATSPNAKGLFIFRVRNRQGVSQLNGRAEIKEFGYLAFENWAKGTSLRSYPMENKRLKRMNLNILSKAELKGHLSTNKPLLYYYIGSPEELSAEISFAGGNKIKWDSCEIDYDNSMDVDDYDDLADYPFVKLKQLSYCPLPKSRQENSYIMSQGQRYRRQEIKDFCLNKILNRELNLQGKNTRTLDREKIDAALVDLMEKAAKTELNIR